jgi:hypothetical protein
VDLAIFIARRIFRPSAGSGLGKTRTLTALPPNWRAPAVMPGRYLAMTDLVRLNEKGLLVIVEKLRMRTLFGVLLAVILTGLLSRATAADGCGPGCHALFMGACVVDGWGRQATVSNECTVTTRARPHCPPGFIWSRSFGACKQTVEDWVGTGG